MDRHNPSIARTAQRGRREPDRAVKVADPYRMDETPTRNQASAVALLGLFAVLASPGVLATQRR